MNTAHVQSLVLRAPQGDAVAHLVAPIPQGRAQQALHLLGQLPVSFGVQTPSQARCLSLGFSFAGLQALQLPQGYQRIFRRLAPAFHQGAVRRSVHLGDSGPSAAPRWAPEFSHGQAHVLISWHGAADQVQADAWGFANLWGRTLHTRVPVLHQGRRLGRPEGQAGQWVHFGFRDGLSEICIDDEQPRPEAPDPRPHKPGALLLGHLNDAGFNSFALSTAPDKLRAFFHDSSFGILRPMLQDLAAFEAQVDTWATQLSQALGMAISPDFVKAKLCGRWPDGSLPRPGDLQPGGEMKLDLHGDPLGQGCPFASHVRRMRAPSDIDGQALARPLQRRSLPFGPAAWSAAPQDGLPRGLLGQFFCASIEDQFEHLLGQWAARAPLGLAHGDRAQDPLIGPHDDPAATLLLPLQGRDTQSLAGFRGWTTTLGTVYTWHPGAPALAALLHHDYEPDEDKGPWL